MIVLYRASPTAPTVTLRIPDSQDWAKVADCAAKHIFPGFNPNAPDARFDAIMKRMQQEAKEKR